MKKIMHILFLSCLKATELIEKKIHFRLSWRERMQLKMHTMMCSACSNYEKQNYFIEKAIAHHGIKTEKPDLKKVDLQNFEKVILKKIAE